MNERIQAFMRLAVALLALAMVLLIAFDMLDAEKLTTAVFAVLAIATECVAWWRNNNVTENAQQAQKYLEHLNCFDAE
jgi:hypothetical protein